MGKALLVVDIEHDRSLIALHGILFGIYDTMVMGVKGFD